MYTCGVFCVEISSRRTLFSLYLYMQELSQMKRSLITVDGPAGAGKGTISNLFAVRNKYVHFDIGQMFRFVTWMILNRHLKDVRKFCGSIERDVVTFLPIDSELIWFFEKEKISRDALQDPQIAKATSQIASDRSNMDSLTDTAVEISKIFDAVICDGRNTGSTIFPNADHKFYVTAKAETRAKRRLADMEKSGLEACFERVLAQISERDLADSTRSYGNLIIPDGAVVIQTDDIEPDDAVQIMELKINTTPP